MKWIITENEACECPGLTLDLLPKKLPANLRVLFRDKTILLEADGLAGIIPCEQGHSIIVEPKCKTLHPFVMYEYVNQLLKITESSIDYDPLGADINMNSLAQFYVKELSNIQRQPRMIRRLPRTDNRTSVKGKVNWNRSARNIKLQTTAPIVSTVQEASFDIPENQILSMAASVCLPLFEKETEEWNTLCHWSRMDYSRNITREKLLRLRAMLKTSRVSGAHAYYKNALALSLVILGVDQMGTITTEDKSILFNMPGLYEDYVRTAFMRKSILKGYSCQKSFVPRSFMFNDGSCELEPDITIYKGTDPIAVLDVKYKVPDSKDYYQIFTYMKYAKLSEAFVISPFVKHRSVMTAYDGSKITGINISQSINTDLETTALEIIEAIS